MKLRSLKDIEIAPRKLVIEVGIELNLWFEEEKLVIAWSWNLDSSRQKLVIQWNLERNRQWTKNAKFWGIESQRKEADLRDSRTFPVQVATWQKWRLNSDLSVCYKAYTKHYTQFEDLEWLSERLGAKSGTTETGVGAKSQQRQNKEIFTQRQLLGEDDERNCIGKIVFQSYSVADQLFK